MFWTVVFWTFFILGFLMPGLWIIAGVAAIMMLRPKHECPTVPRFVKPCPRCSNNDVKLWNRSNGYYFTCGWCGARGAYPWVDPNEREMAAHP